MNIMCAISVILAAVELVPASSSAAERTKIRFAVGPYQPTAGDTRKAYEPFFKYIADAVGADYELTVTTDWAGIAIALTNGQADVTWMGPWGYVLAHHQGGAEAIATVKYDGKPTYHSIIIARPDLTIKNYPDDAKGMSLSLADVGSTSGWLIPTYYLSQKGIDPKTYFKYRDGASHAANVTAVANGQVDLASDYNRNLDAMIAKGLVSKEQVKVVWQSEPLPNDALVVRKGLAQELTEKIRAAVLAIDEDKAKEIMPPRYTGWVAATHASYKYIEDAGRTLGRIKDGN
ncbi:MAG: phosphate/phosphite/phosphonate ABC transporter substrate-binding protein [Hyphomicrobiaceae bacterium]|nr:phosphate/phosphite/phosphonate ABC transporter substrate-binding protein [Hyphomicrobiaceae bacterium]